MTKVIIIEGKKNNPILVYIPNASSDAIGTI